MALVQKRPFFELLFQAIQAKELSFTIFQIEKTPFQPIKTTSLRSRKIYIFPKGLTHCFGPNMATFLTFFEGNIGQENVFYDILERKNSFPGYKRKKFGKSKNCHFSKGFNPCFWSKNGHFSNFSFQAIQFSKMSVAIFQNEKTPFQALKKISSKNRKIDIFSKGLPMVLVQKWPFFKLFLLGNIGQGNVFYDIPERKICFFWL